MAAKSALTGPLTLTLHGCTGLKDVQTFGKQDPFAKLHYGSEKFQTKVHDDGGKAPVWEQSFIVNLDGSDDAVHLQVLNKNTLADDLIGRADIPVLNLAQASGKVGYQLVDPNAFKVVVGTINITASFAGKGLPEKEKPKEEAKPAQPAQQQQQQQQQAQPQVVYVQAPAQPQVVYVQAPAPQVVYQTAAPVQMLTVHVYWHQGRQDNWNIVHTDAVASAQAGKYTYVRADCKIFATQAPGTVPLNSYWSEARKDNFTCASDAGQKDALAAGYRFIRTEGYVYPTPQQGTIPFKTYWHRTRQDNYSAAHSQGQRDALGAGYSFIRDDCYVFPA